MLGNTITAAQGLAALLARFWGFSQCETQQPSQGIQEAPPGPSRFPALRRVHGGNRRGEIGATLSHEHSKFRSLYTRTLPHLSLPTTYYNSTTTYYSPRHTDGDIKQHSTAPKEMLYSTTY